MIDHHFSTIVTYCPYAFAIVHDYIYDFASWCVPLATLSNEKDPVGVSKIRSKPQSPFTIHLKHAPDWSLWGFYHQRMVCALQVLELCEIRLRSKKG